MTDPSASLRTGSVVIGIFTPLVATLALPGLTERCESFWPRCEALLTTD